MKLLIINYSMDEKHQVFSHQVEVVNYLSKHFSQVTVLTGSMGSYHVSKNVKVISYNWVEGKRLSSLVNFLLLFIKVIKAEKFSVVFSHMTSVQSVFIAPITKIARLKHFLWYAHTSNGIYLKITRVLINGIITSTPGSCPLKGSNIYPIGQSIDRNKFSKKLKVSWPITRLVHVGRFDPSKNIEKMVSTVANIRNSCPDLTLEIIGSPSSEKFIDDAAKIKEQFSSNFEFDWLKFTPHISRASLPEILKTKDCFIHSFQGSLDKTLVEATFSCLPVVTINKEYLNVFGGWDQDDKAKSSSLERQFRKILALSANELQVEVDRRYELAIRQHELSGWVDRLVYILKSG